MYPNATHNRFQHSLGVGHLGRVLCNTLRDKQPNLGITDVDVNCVMIAGLCHDLGHGPYSHLWEGFIKEARDRRDIKEEYHHEDMSVKMFDRMLEENAGLKETLKEEGGIEDRDLLFIKELIVGPLDEDGMPDRSKEALDSTRADSAVWPYRGRSEDKSFLYEIIANKITGKLS